MATETLEQKTLDVERVLKVFKKALLSKNPDHAINYLRDVVSRATYDGKIDAFSLVNLSRETQKLVEKYGKKPYAPPN